MLSEIKNVGASIIRYLARVIILFFFSSLFRRLSGLPWLTELSLFQKKVFSLFVMEINCIPSSEQLGRREVSCSCRGRQLSVRAIYGAFLFIESSFKRSFVSFEYSVQITAVPKSCLFEVFSFTRQVRFTVTCFNGRKVRTRHNLTATEKPKGPRESW